MGKELNARGWSRRAVQALGWLWENQDIERESPDLELSSQEPGDGVFLLLLCCFLERVPEKEALHLFQSGELPDENLVTSDGSLIFLRSGFLLFPGQLISSAGEPRFYRSWKKREKKVAG